jgi:hypothetical protein
MAKFIGGKHTPGPWANDGERIFARDAHGAIYGKYIADAETETNAALIAKAPELFEALAWVIRSASIMGPLGVEAYIISPERMEQARAIIRELE